jgi:regulatory protein YycH of two-component signal transduction system YycFG
MIKNLSDMNKDLLEIQKRKQDLQPKVTNNTQNLNIDKAVFVGSTAELLKQLRENK